MLPCDSDRQVRAVAHDERVGKVFLVVADDMRQCLICDRVFSRQASFEHSTSICYPAPSNMH